MVPSPPTSVSIRAATSADAGALWQLRHDAIRLVCSEAYEPHIIEQWLSTPMPEGWARQLEEKQAIVAERDGEAIGFGIVDLDAGTLEAAFVAPSEAGTGVGKALVDELEAFALRNGLTALSLQSSLNAVGFYERMGYQIDDRDIFSHPDGFDMDCYRMSKVLSGVTAADGRDGDGSTR